MSTKYQSRRDTAANWTSNNPTLLNGEIGYETDTGYFKIGDGSTAWTSLAYTKGDGSEIDHSSLTNLSYASAGHTGFQPLDAELTALAGLTSAADKLPYFTGSGTADVTSLTAFARSILDDANEATFKATVNLEIGTDVLAYDAGLSNLAGVSMAANKFYYTSADNVHVAGDVTAAARSIMDDASVGDIRTTLGVGTGDSPTFAGTTITGCAVLGLNSASFQPTANSTTFIQLKQADGTVFVTFNSTNKKIGVNTLPNASMGAALQVEGNLAVGNISSSGEYQQVYITGASGEVPAGVLYTAENFGAASNENLSFGASFNRGTAGAKVGIYYYSASPAGWLSGLELANVASGYNDLILMKSGGNVGIGESSPVTQLEMTGTAPYFTLHNSTEEDGDGGRECRLIARGEQSGTEESVLGWLEFAHDGASDDEKGYVEIKVNATGDGTTPSVSVFKGNSAGIVTMNGLYACRSDGDTGGSGSAGSGNQYVEVEINGTTYKVLHDGTV